MEEGSVIREKKHRLDKKEYIGVKRVSFTLCVENKKKLFCDRKIVVMFLDVLAQVLIKYNARNWVYVFMDDHLHMVLEGLMPDSDLWKAVKEFKQKTGLWLSKNSIMKWQKDFYDHIHRENEILFYSVWYIANNPVRKGLVKDCLDYEGLGSLDFDVKELLKNMELTSRE